MREEPAVDDSDDLALEDVAKQVQMNQGISFYFFGSPFAHVTNFKGPSFLF
jgi:hypothetical protein